MTRSSPSPVCGLSKVASQTMTAAMADATFTHMQLCECAASLATARTQANRHTKPHIPSTDWRATVWPQRHGWC
eukprot:1881961-Alexandrium_andersonii.AAC.1